jgi:hypothetical protein
MALSQDLLESILSQFKRMTRHCWPLLGLAFSLLLLLLLPLALAKRGSLPLDLRQDVSHRDPKSNYSFENYFFMDFYFILFCIC